MKAAAGITAVGLLIGLSGVAHADLITNGDFEITTNGNGQLGYNTNATGWTTTGYNFVFAPGTADTTGATGSYGGLTLWGPGNGTNNGLPAASPSGGNFIAADGAFQTEPLTQTITGLVPGETYRVSFYWAAAQQSGFDGPTTDQWLVSLGSNMQATSIASLPSHGFSPWKAEAFDYVATSNSEVLSFLASGTPTGLPPFALLDGVTMNLVPQANVPEPAAFASLGLGVLGFGVFARRRRARATKSAS